LGRHLISTLSYFSRSRTPR